MHFLDRRKKLKKSRGFTVNLTELELNELEFFLSWNSREEGVHAKMRGKNVEFQEVNAEN